MAPAGLPPAASPGVRPAEGWSIAAAGGAAGDATPGADEGGGSALEGTMAEGAAAMGSGGGDAVRTPGGLGGGAGRCKRVSRKEATSAGVSW